MDIRITKMEGYSTAQVAKIIGVSKNTLLRWLYQGRLKEPRRMDIAGKDWRVWTALDIRRARKLKATIKPGPKPRRKGGKYGRK